MHSPQPVDWSRLKHLLRYLKGTITHGLYFSKHSPMSLTSFSDADWAGDKSDRRSTSRFLIYLGNNLISWNSKKQPTVARSSTEAEYKAIANATSELIWINSLLREIRIVIQPPTLWCDNIGATYLSTNPVFHARMKHIEIDFHFVREQVASRRLRVCVISEKDQTIDLLTKPLPKIRFLQLRSKLNLLSALRLWGGVEENAEAGSAATLVRGSGPRELDEPIIYSLLHLISSHYSDNPLSDCSSSTYSIIYHSNYTYYPFFSSLH